MDTQRAPLALGEHAEITSSLSRFYYAECVALSRNRKIVSVVAGNLEKDAGVWPALIRLAGRMKKAGAEAEAGRVRPDSAYRAADALQRVFMLLVHLNVGEQREV